MENNRPATLHYRFDVSTFRLLGRELITDRITALFELVKNCYDANAQTVNISFENINPLGSESRIVIEDNGIGMSYKDIKDKWMVIGTSNKRRNDTSPAPYYRKVVGKKGVGRFAVDKLGAKLVLRSKQIGSQFWECLETDWSIYADEENKQLALDEDIKLFTEIDNRYWRENGDASIQGTRLEISNINDVWTEQDIKRAYLELAKLVRPSVELEYPFTIWLDAPQYQDFKNKKVVSLALAKATLSYNIRPFEDQETGFMRQQCLRYEKGKLAIVNEPLYSFGPVSLSLNYYDKAGKDRFYKLYPEDKIDGVKIYRDGLIATPFAEYKGDSNEKKDLFGIDKRQWSDFFTRLSTRDIIGYVDITKKFNPDIIDSTNRQDFVDNIQWRDLQAFVIDQIKQIEQYLKYLKLSRRESNINKIQTATEDLDDVKSRVDAIKENARLSSPEISKELDDLALRLNKIKGKVVDGSAEYKQMEEEHRLQANIMYSLISLQRYASQMSHIIKTSVGMIKRSAEFVAKWMRLGQKQERCIKHAQIIYDDMNNLTKAIDFMLSYTNDDTEFEPFDIKSCTELLFNELYSGILADENIKYEVLIEESLELNYSRKAFEDMIGCLMDNSIKALRNKEDKRIKCTISATSENLTILFSDNGIGIPEENKPKVFDEFFTTTSDFGGAGLGLFMVRTRLEAISGSIEIVENEFLPLGATFKICIPIT